MKVGENLNIIKYYIKIFFFIKCSNIYSKKYSKKYSRNYSIKNSKNLSIYNFEKN